jgi:hypothetical protein
MTMWRAFVLLAPLLLACEPGGERLFFDTNTGGAAPDAGMQHQDASTSGTGGSPTDPPDAAAPDAPAPQPDAAPPDAGCVPDAGPGTRYVNDYGQPCNPCVSQCIPVDCSACTVNNVPPVVGDPYACAPLAQPVTQQQCTTEPGACNGAPQPPPPNYLSCGSCYNFLCTCFQWGCSEFHPQ